MDENNGRLVLISEQTDDITLPPLRLDDVVTIFRSVYEMGEAPFVSIDPDPKDPQGPTMLTHHGKATGKSYVGWVMFESDRVMKAYSLGTDNVSKKTITSSIEGYKSLLDLGSGDPDHKDSVWERFWIVPDRVQIKNDAESKLSLFDIPLKVMTQRMVLENGKLIPADDDTPSPQAKAFADWFTDNYDQLSDEVLSYPPKELGLQVPVSFFKELKRVALITAIAEHLRSQGISMPQWMKQHEPQTCRLDATTPAINATVEQTMIRKKGKWFWASEEKINIRRNIYGGVSLGTHNAEAVVRNNDEKADQMIVPLLSALDNAPVASPVSFQFKEAGKVFNAVTMPSDTTKATGACLVKEIDLSIPLPFDQELRFERVFHSFFEASDHFGSSWSLDLPCLEKQQEPFRDQSGQAKLKTVFNLSTPFNSCSARSSDKEFVPEFEKELLTTKDSPHILGIGKIKNSLLKSACDVVFFKDGTQLLFNADGCIAAKITPPLTTIYSYEKGSLVSISGFYGSEKQAHIHFDYNQKGWIQTARSSNGDLIVYSYSNAGKLSTVSAGPATLYYEYENSLLTAMIYNNETIRIFEYDSQGILKKEWKKTGPDSDIEIIYLAGRDGRHHQSEFLPRDTQNPEAGMKTSVEYDSRFKPRKKRLTDGTLLEWQTDQTGNVITTYISPKGEKTTILQDQDGLKRTWYLPNDVKIDIEHDTLGRMNKIVKDGQVIQKRSWRHDGQLDTITTTGTAYHQEYNPDGTLNSVLITQPSDDNQFNKWVKEKFNTKGQLVETTDYTGFKSNTAFDSSGKPVSMAVNDNLIHFSYDESNRVDTIKMSTIGKEIFIERDNENQDIRTIKIASGNNLASVTFENGFLKKATGFHGESHEIEYNFDKTGNPILNRIQTPDNCDLTFLFDDARRLNIINYDGVRKWKTAYDENNRITGLEMVKIV